MVILDSLSALKLQNLDNCTVFVGPVAGSVFVRNCNKCIVHVVARQLRIHDSVDTTWYAVLLTCAEGSISNVFVLCLLSLPGSLCSYLAS